MCDAYFAGLFDGEGSVGIYRGSNGKGTNEKKFYAVRLAVVGTHMPMIRAAYEHFGVGLFTTQKRQKLIQSPRGQYSVKETDGAKLCKQGWKWGVTDQRGVRTVLTRVVPYLIEKRRQAEIVLDYLDGKLDGEAAIELCRSAKRFEFPLADFEEYKPRRTENFRGESNRYAKLTNEQVRDIRANVDQKTSKLVYAKQIAAKYGMSVSGMYKVILGASYRWVEQGVANGN
jgi:hypothetical protein